MCMTDAPLAYWLREGTGPEALAIASLAQQSRGRVGLDVILLCVIG